MGTSALGQDFQTIDRVDGWLIERKRDSEQNHVCRASLSGGGSWFSARVPPRFNLAVDRVAFETPNTADSQKAGIDRWYKQQSHGLKLTALQAVSFNDKLHGMQGVSGSNPLGSISRIKPVTDRFYGGP